jgi:fumarate reductase subunit C
VSAAGPPQGARAPSGGSAVHEVTSVGAAVSTQRGSTSDAIAQAKRWYWQRISAMVLALCVLVHLAVIIYAVRGGLSGAEILARTRGNWGFGAFYTAFVVACAVHVPTGLARIAEEWLAWRPAVALNASRLFALLLLALGLRAVYAVVAP